MCIFRYFGEIKTHLPFRNHPTSAEMPQVAFSYTSNFCECSILPIFQVIDDPSTRDEGFLHERDMGLLSLVNNIARERGLDRQNYKCQGCSRPIGMSKYGFFVRIISSPHFS